MAAGCYESCGELFAEGDVFCGRCGTPTPALPWSSEGATAGASPGYRAIHEASSLNPPAPFQPWSAGLPPTPPSPFHQPTSHAEHFTHAAPRASGPMSNATRYLCAASYLVPSFAATVLGELIGSR